MNEFIAISFIIVLAAISPGPDFAMMIKNSLSGNRIIGLCTALGISISLLIHSTYSMFGLALIISQSPFTFNLIKIMGASYLIYIGIKSLMEKRSHAPDLNKIQLKHDTIQNNAAFVQGLLCNLLNPKAILFILSFFTLIITPDSSLAAQFGFGLEIALIHFIWFSLLAIMITHPPIRNKLNRIQYYIVKVMGAALVGFGIRIASLTQIVN